MLPGKSHGSSSLSWVSVFTKRQDATAASSCRALGPELAWIRHIKGRSNLSALVRVNMFSDRIKMQTGHLSCLIAVSATKSITAEQAKLNSISSWLEKLKSFSRAPGMPARLRQRGKEAARCDFCSCCLSVKLCDSHGWPKNPTSSSLHQQCLPAWPSRALAWPE